MTRTTTACRMGRPSPPYFARLHSFSFDSYVINRCHRSAKRSIPNRQNTIRAIFNGSATCINRTSICTVFDSQCTIIINRAISACFRCRRINYAPPCYCQGTSVHNRPACKARRHGNTVALHVQDNILVSRNSDNLLRRHLMTIANVPRLRVMAALTAVGTTGTVDGSPESRPVYHGVMYDIQNTNHRLQGVSTWVTRSLSSASLPLFHRSVVPTR